MVGAAGYLQIVCREESRRLAMAASATSRLSHGTPVASSAACMETSSRGVAPLGTKVESSFDAVASFIICIESWSCDVAPVGTKSRTLNASNSDIQIDL